MTGFSELGYSPCFIDGVAPATAFPPSNPPVVADSPRSKSASPPA